MYTYVYIYIYLHNIYAMAVASFFDWKKALAKRATLASR